MNNATAKTPRAAAPIAPYMALAGIWLLTIFIVPPRGDFPLNDDWMYAKVVQHLVETGEYQATPYADPTFILQAYWGAAFVKLFGFSFETLRISTLVLGLVAVWAAHWAAREAGLNTHWAFLVALTLLVNPLFLNLSYTFMTDVPFIALMLLSGAATVHALRTKDLRWLAISMSLTACAALIRQFAVVIPMAVSFILFESPKTEPLKKTLRQGAAFAIPLLMLAGLYVVLPIGGLPATEGWDWTRLGDSWFSRIAEVGRHLSVAFTYVSILSVALFAAGAIRKTEWTKRSGRIAATIAVGSVIVFFLGNRQWPYRLPNMGNLLYDFGVGPLLLPGMVEGDAIAAPLRLGSTTWWLLTIIALPGAAAFAILHLRAIFRFSSAWDGDTDARSELFLALWSLGLLTVLVLPPILGEFDRYFLMAQIPAVILVARWFAKGDKQPARTAYVVSALVWFVGVVCLQDYLAWNGARWNALAALQRDHGAPLEQINGGYEFNGWFHSDVYAEESRRTGKKIFGTQGWWIRGDDYRVSLRPNKHFEVIGTEPYFSWLGWERREILLLKRTEPDTNSALFD